jgi:hypothetical protein
MSVTLKRGVMSASHTEQDIRNEVDAAKQVLEENMQSSKEVLAS